MSKRHPVIAVTGSSGAGTTTTGRIFSRMFASEGYHAAMVSGDSFHRYTREQMARLAELDAAWRQLHAFRPPGAQSVLPSSTFGSQVLKVRNYRQRLAHQMPNVCNCRQLLAPRCSACLTVVNCWRPSAQSV